MCLAVLLLGCSPPSTREAPTEGRQQVQGSTGDTRPEALLVSHQMLRPPWPLDTIQIIDVEARRRGKFLAPAGLESAVALSANGRYFASTCMISRSEGPWAKQVAGDLREPTRFFAVYETTTGKPVMVKTYREFLEIRNSEFEGGIRDLEFSRDGSVLYISYAAPIGKVGIAALDLKTLEVDWDVYRVDISTRRHAADIFDFSVSPDGRYLLLRELRDGSAGTSDKYLYDRRTKTKTLIPLDGKQASNLAVRHAWRPDSRGVVLAFDSLQEASLYFVPAENPGRPQRIVELADPRSVRMSKDAAFSPDGKFLMYSEEKRGVVLRHLEPGKDEVIAAPGADGSARRGSYVWHPSWSASGRFLAFQVAVALPGAPVPYYRLYVYDTNTRELRSVGDYEHPLPVFVVDDPATIAELWAKMEPIEKGK
jgi:dipeptidyl aminopeptidase/acylaminoacyl peptidase